MHRTSAGWRVGALSLALVVGAAGASRAAEHDPAGLVDPFIGTLGAGFVFPGPAAPYGMVQLSPDTDGYFAYTGYQYSDQFIRGFSHVHVESMGVPEGGNVPFMPTTGPILSTDVKRYQSKFEHASEEAEPGYYRVLLDTYGTVAELTAGTRVGMHRYTFPPTDQANVLLDIGRQVPGGDFDEGGRVAGQNVAHLEFLEDNRTVIGTANTDRAAPHHYSVHFAARFDRPFATHGVWGSRGAAVQSGDEITGRGAGGVVSFDATADRDVVVKVGISFVDTDNALANLEAELPGDDFDFDALRAGTRAAWNEALSVAEVTGGTPTEQIAFFTALYHAQHHPNVFNDANGEYLGHDDVVHQIGAPGDPMPAGSTYYANFSMWDTYRAEMPLLMLLVPDRMRDMMRSLAAIVTQGGSMPRWAMMNRNPNFMNGEPALQVIADAGCRGLIPADAVSTLYDAARTVALETRRDQDFYSVGYTREASNTLEYALGDFALALLADSTGEDADRDALLAQGAQWRNLFDAEGTKFIRPREPDGSWMEPYYPEMPDRFREGTGWQYTWLVPQDLGGLFAAMGPELAAERLDIFFAQALSGTVPLLPHEVQQKLTAYGIAYYGNQYAPSNEHDLQAPWIYNWLGQPWKTQALQRGYQGLFRAAPDGLPGNDDLGTMSAWFAWSALGFYPVTPGSPTYTIGSPMFERVVLHLPGGDTVIEADGASLVGKYVQSATVDGVAHDTTWVTHDVLAGGSTVKFSMGPVASSTWGSAPQAAPPSSSTHPLAAFGCAP